jgi:hypothetical protein
VLGVVLLFVAYLQVSRTYPENSDESNDLLMAWDMLHGNVLLHGWYLSDVSFVTTELPQYAILERFFGLHTDTAHIAAAMTYTLVVVLAMLLAKGADGKVPAREAWPRMLLTAGLVFAPQLGVGVFVLLLSLGHIGTAVPLMLTWLVMDRAGPEGRLVARLLGTAATTSFSPVLSGSVLSGSVSSTLPNHIRNSCHRVRRRSGKLRPPGQPFALPTETPMVEARGCSSLPHRKRIGPSGRARHRGGRH